VGRLVDRVDDGLHAEARVRHQKSFVRLNYTHTDTEDFSLHGEAEHLKNQSFPRHVIDLYVFEESEERAVLVVRREELDDIGVIKLFLQRKYHLDDLLTNNCWRQFSTFLLQERLQESRRAHISFHEALLARVPH